MRRGHFGGIKRLGTGVVVLFLCGCHQHHYYLNGSQPMVATEAPMGTIASYGDVCDVPAGTAVVANGPVVTRPASGPVIVGGTPMGVSNTLAPQRPGLFGNRFSRSWRASDPEQRIVLKADGAYDDSAVIR